MSGKQVEHAPAQVVETSWDRVWASQTSKVLTIAPPYVVWPIIAGIGTVFHKLWGDNGGQSAAWSAIGLTLGTILLAAVTWLVSHSRNVIGRSATTATSFAVGMWVTACSVAGISQDVVFWFWLAGGLVVCACWNVRTVIRSRVEAAGYIDDPLAFLFDRNKGKAKLDKASVKTIEATDRKIEAEMDLPAGEKTVTDLQKKVEYIEGAMELPPGSMNVSADLDNAAKAKVVISDPRIMRNPIPWPGPSRPGGSIAEPIRPGVWQDLDDVEYVIVGHHVQVAGKTGSGKSIGCAWDTLAEIFTRRDPMVLAIDIVKQKQTLGPLEKGLHRFEITEEGARELIRELRDKLAERTNYLTSKGLVKWKKGCGLTYIVLWIEEAWKLFEIFTSEEMEEFEELMKALRSAGGTVFYSLQRGDSSQVPTLVKGQTAKWCFGMESSHDARWGLSEKQLDAGAAPELWGSDQPGMCYLHAPGMDNKRIAMPMRTFDWRKPNGDEDVEAIRAHCEKYAAADKPVDHISASLVLLPDGQQPDGQQPDGQQPEVIQAEPSADMPIEAEERELLAQAAELVVATGYASTQMLQRKLRVGHAQAGALLRELARHGVVGADAGDEGRCRVLVDADHLDDVVAALRDGKDDGARTPDPDPSVKASLDDPIEDDPDDQPFEFARPESAPKMSPDEARRVLLEQIEAWRAKGRERFATRDMAEVLTRTGMKRPWAQKHLKEMVNGGSLGYDDEAREFVIRTLSGARS